MTGFRAWLLQRLSAVYMMTYLLYAFTVLAFVPSPDFEMWRSWFAEPMMGASTAVFFTALLLHTWVGVRNVIMDYVHTASTRLMLLYALASALLTMGWWVLRALLRLIP